MSRSWTSSLVIGNPGNRRINLWQAAVRHSGRPPSTVLSYLDLLDDLEQLTSMTEAADVVRLDSPGENAQLEARLILRGCRLSEDESTTADTVEATTKQVGRIFLPHRWVRGYQDLLRELELTSRAMTCWLSSPSEVAVLFDKPSCQQRLRGAAIPTPRPLGLVETYDQLREQMRAASCSRVYVKLPGGSSASGVVALSTSPTRVRAVTSVEMETGPSGVRLFNSLNVQHYDREQDVSRLIEALTADGPLHVEEWVPKAGHAGRTFDLRIVVIAGEPQHTVVRTSADTLTNLHLGNRRGDLNALKSVIPKPSWEAAMQTCIDVAALFPGCLMLGVDLAFTPGYSRHFVIEVNAFGDLLPGITHNGRDTYAAQVEALS